MNTFRLLNENELTAIKSAMAKKKIPESHPFVTAPNLAEVSYENIQGGFCVCIVKTPIGIENGYLVYRGASRRSYKDARNVLRGEMLAFNRAILYSRGVELT